MKKSYFHLVLLALLGLSALTANAAQLASAKVLNVSGTVNSHSEDGVEKQLIVGAILSQGDSIVTTAMSNALLVFSNGSELVVEENSSISIANLSQEAFGGNKSYEQLQADPSSSQSLLELNYGKVSGHVKKLRSGSEFNIETPLGTAAIRGTKFQVELRYSVERGEFILIVHNKDGKVNIISRYGGSFEYGRGNVGDKGYDSAVSDDTIEAIPPAHIIVIRLSKDDPNYDRIINAVKNYPPTKSPSAVIPVGPVGPEITPEDQDTVIASPNSPSN